MVADLKVDVLDVAAASTSDVEEGEAGCGTKVDVAYAPSLDGVVRRGNAFTATFKIFIAVMGAGSLVLASAMAALGWVAGIICMLLFAAITFGCGQLLIMCHEHDGKRHHTYYSAVRHILGARHAKVLFVAQQIKTVMMALSYAITSGTSMASIATLFLEDTSYSIWTNPCVYVLFFSFVMLFVIQINSLKEMFIVCFLGSCCVAVYITAVIYLGAANWAMYGACGSLGGAYTTAASKVWAIANALGLLFFSWSVASVLMEIVDVIATHPVRRGRKAFSWAYAMVAVILFTVAIVTYGSVGDDAPNWFLDAFSAPKWVVVVANLAIVLSLIPAYNLYLIPFLQTVERPLERRFPRLHPRLLKLVWRSCVVIIMAIIGALLPFFTCFTALAGAIGFWPLTVYFPIALWIQKYKPKLVTRLFLHSVNVFSFAVTVLAAVGSVERIVVSAQNFEYAWSS